MSRAAVTTEGKAIKATGRDLDMLDLWLSGASYRQIASMPQVRMSHEGVRRAVNRALGKLAEETAERLEKVRPAAMARLDRLLLSIWQRAVGGDLGAIREARQIIATHAKVAGVLASDHGDDELAAIFAERERLAELHGEAVVQVLVLVLGNAEIGIPPEKQELARRLAGQHLRELAAGESA